MKNDGVWFDTLSNTSPCRNTDPRNDEDYDTFLYGTEPLPGDRTWRFKKAGVQPNRGRWKGAV